MATKSLEATARALYAGGGWSGDPDVAVDEITRELSVTPGAGMNATPRGRRAAAAKVVPGATPPLTKAEEAAALDAAYPVEPSPTPAAPARPARGRRRSRVPTLPAARLRGASSLRGLIGQVLGLLILYWVLTDATKSGTGGVLATALRGVGKGIAWLGSIRGVPTSTPSWASVPAPPPGFASSDAARHEAAGQGASAAATARWRPLVAKWFPPAQVDKALRVMWCESRGNPSAVNPTSRASGLFQHMPQWWAARSAAAGFAGRSPFDPEANVATAAWLYQRDGWGAWSCGDA